MKTDVDPSFRAALDLARREHAELLAKRDELLAKAEAARGECNQLRLLVRSLRDLLGLSEPTDEELAMEPPPTRGYARRKPK